MGKTTKYTERKFLGTLREDATKEDKKHYEKHLNAYLKGRTFFYDGYITTSSGLRERVSYPVMQEIKVDQEKRKLLTGK